MNMSCASYNEVIKIKISIIRDGKTYLFKILSQKKNLISISVFFFIMQLKILCKHQEMFNLWWIILITENEVYL